LTLAAVVDNDVLQKFSSYGLMPELEGAIRGNGTVGILGAARFIVRRALSRVTSANESKLHTAFEAFLNRAAVLEPMDEEIALATEMEEVANRQSLGFDSGESQLCAIAITRAVDAVVTGDKRAIEAAEDIKNIVGSLAGLEGKIVCLEQTMLGVIEAVGYSKPRSHVCAVREADTTLSICLKCWSSETPSEESIRSSFASYIDDLRRKAPSLLYVGYVFPNS
jgi:hypothetical protein